MITITERGFWRRYVPDPFPKDLPAYVLFARRDGDGVDWYDLLNAAALEANTIKMTVFAADGHSVVQAANRDATRLFPAGTLLLEVAGDDAPDPQAAFGGREYFPAEKSFGELWRPLTPISDRQFFQALALEGLITPEEALAAVRTGQVPAAMEAFIDAIADPDAQFAARMLLSGATTFERDHPLVSGFASTAGLAPAQIDELWRKAATL